MDTDTSSCTRINVTVEQLRILIEAIENDPSLFNVHNSHMISFYNVKKWLDLADKLNNAYGNVTEVGVSEWKCLLRYWIENTISKVNKVKDFVNKIDVTITEEEAEELDALEKRLVEFIKQEEAKLIVDVTYSGVLNPIPNSGNGTAEGAKFVIQLVNVFSTDDKENNSPDSGKRRTVITKEDDPSDPTGKTKKFKIIFNQLVDDEQAPEPLIMEDDLDRMQRERFEIMSRDLTENIATIRNRIHMIKDMWKHRCGDN